MHRSVWLAILLLASLTAGCLGNVEPAEIPEEAYEERGWQKTRDDTQSLALGLVEVVIREYSDPQGFSGITLATAPDFPFIDEENDLIPLALDRVEEDQGVEFVPIGTRTLQLANIGGQVTANEYDVRGKGVPAKAVIFSPSCNDFVAVVAYGVSTSSDGGLFGGSGTSLYKEAQEISRRVVCGA